MIRTDIITTIGRKYLTSNIENEEFSYGKALKSIGKEYTDYLTEDAKRTYKDLDIRFTNEKLSILKGVTEQVKNGYFPFSIAALASSFPFLIVTYSPNFAIMPPLSAKQ